MPPTAPAITGLPFQSASDTVSPNPSRRLFWRTTVEARWIALISTFAVGGSSTTWTSASPAARSRHSVSTRAPSGSSVADEEQLAVVVLAGEPVRLDDAE